MTAEFVPSFRLNRELESKLKIDPATAIFSTPMEPLILTTRPSNGKTEPDSLRIEIDTASYVLNVVRDNVILRSFPVGLDRDGATPSGDFQIANKISEPDWYFNGDAIPAGDAANPLGSSWMGLGDGANALSYGLHPTDDSASIGQPMSEGCVRMRPRDAETLFRLVPLGTPVRIRP